MEKGSLEEKQKCFGQSTVLCRTLFISSPKEPPSKPRQGLLNLSPYPIRDLPTSVASLMKIVTLKVDLELLKIH